MILKILLVISILITLNNSILPNSKTEVLIYRLPSNVKPIYYDLNINIDVDALKFEGDVTIDIETLEETRSIAINYKDIDVAWEDVVLLDKSDSVEYKFETIELQAEYEIAFIRFDSMLPLGFYSITLSFSANIRNDLKGLYKSTYDNANVIATTHFEPSYARMVFPCFDEPHLKAVFSITVIHDEKYTAISNMRQATTGPVPEEDGFIFTTFEDTPLMSTYLVAFIVSEYKRQGKDTDSYVGYAPPGEELHTDDSIQFAPMAMKALENFLGVDYQLPLTQLAAINDFLFGAMENWGLVTFRSEYLLYPNSYISPRIHQHSRLLISHEFAHMWFGNEVTPEWWTHIWLSEGFAQFFQYYTTDELEPSWRIWEQFNVNNLQSALSQDDKNNIRTMSEPIFEASETQFDYIVYAKSSSIIRMFYEIIGKEAFKKVLNKYLTDNSYGTVVPEDLFASFQSVIDTENIVLPKSFAELFESWSNELGYPVINANVQTSSGIIVVSQKRFFVDPDLMKTSAKGNYYIPITVATDKNGDNYDVYWLSPDIESITINFEVNANFVVLNKYQAGYYRVNYNEDYWLYLVDFLSDDANTASISEENRAQLIDDAANLAKAGLISYEILFKLLHNLQHDTGFLPWMAANNAISYLARMLLGSAQHERFEHFLRIIPNKNYETYKIDVDYNKQVDRLHRVNSVAWACLYGHEECVKDVRNIIKTIVTDDNAQFADEIKPFVFCAFSRYTDKNDDSMLPQQLMMKMINSFTSNDKVILGQMNEIITGLGCTRDTTNINYLIDLSLNPVVLGIRISAEIRTRIVVALVNGSYEGVQIMIEYLTDKFANLLEMYESAGIVSVLNALGSRIVTEEVETLFDSFITTLETQLREVPSMYDAATRAQSTIAANLNWRKTYADDIETWLQNNIDELPTVEPEEPEPGEPTYRLPSNLKPSYYDLNIKIDVEASTFEGEVLIDIEILEETKSIAINYKDIEVAWENVELLRKSDPTVEYKFETVELQTEYEIAYIRFTTRLPVGFYSIRLSFSDNIRNDLKGLYKSTYDTNKVIATTHFEPSYARMVFPCFDEPHLKAVFNITVIHDEKFTAISNTRKATSGGSEPEEDGFIFTTFEDTPLMSTYLVAFIVSEYKRQGKDTDSYVAYAPPGEELYTDDAIQFAPTAMKALENFLDVEYQLPLTQLAAINDFLFGAMENWGLVTFRSEYLLYPNSYISPRIHQHSRLLISHEFAHMWFGNEVTPEWWTYIWLSEGFAQFFQYYTTDELEPSWRIWEQFNVNNLQSALSQDDKNNIRTMSEPIFEASETQFDYIVYAKSSSIIRMFYEIIGKEAFKKVLNKYLTDNSYGTVVPEDLFASFQSVIDTENIVLPKSFAELFESWSNELGYPVINANVQTSSSKIVVSQNRFFVDPDLMKTSTKGNYYIPITVATDKNGDNYDVYWLSPDIESITINFDVNANFVVLNKYQAGYYRVNYNEDYWLYLVDFLSDEANTALISEENRAQLIDDAANLAKAGLVSYEILFKLLQNLQHDTGFLPWMAANNAISYLARMLLGSAQHDRFENFLRIIPSKNYETYKIDVEYNKHVDRLHRVNSVAWACLYGHEECVKDVRNIIKTIIADDNAQFADEIRPFVFCAFSRYTDKNDDSMLHQQLMTKMINSFTSNDKVTLGQMNEIITGLGCTRDTTNINYLINLSLNPVVLGIRISAEIRTRIAVALVNGSYEGVQIMIEYLTDKFANLLEMYESAGIVSVLNALGSRIVTEEVETLFDSFITTLETQLREVPSMYDAATRAQSTIAANLNWRKTYGDDIETWLQNNIDELPTVEPEEPEPGEPTYRLPSNLKPNYYDLNIKIDVEASTFEGEVLIDIEILEETKSIAINYKDIEVAWENVELLRKSDPTVEYKFETVELQTEYEIAYIRFTTRLPVGFYTIRLSFSDNIRNDLKGLYKSTYDTNKVIATTHFEPSYARMVFPCFDEPHLKAVFNITVIHDEKFTAISNTRKATSGGSEPEEDGFIFTTFEDTPLMSTYLVAFIVSEYRRQGKDTDSYVAYAPPGEEFYTDDAIQFAPTAMKALENFLDVEYQLPLTQLAAINDFLFGAMENWGLVTFRSEYLLYPNSYISPRIHQHSRLLISHEFAHMWFGNEVTPEWWTHIWLSEGFAQFFQYYTTDELEPSWRIWEQFNVNNLQSALSQDDKNNIRTMSEPIFEASETQFDYIVYAKSSSIIRMFYEIIGNKAFKKVLNKYLTDNSYGTVVPEDLFASFQSVIDTENIVLPKSFAELFESWSNELGYPVINANVQTSSSKIVVSQKRFFVDPDLMKTSTKGNYYIPITVATDKNGDNYDVYWLSPDIESITINLEVNANFVVLNKYQAGYYRVNYNEDYWLYLVDFLSDEANTASISEENRAQLIDDAANLAKAGLVSYEILFKLLQNLQHDTGFLPWMAANNVISHLARMLLGSAQHDRFENFLRIIPSKNYETYKIDVEYNKHVDRLHRVNSVAWACQYGHEECVKDVRNIISTFVADDNAQFADEIRPFVFCTFSRYTDINDELIQRLMIKMVYSFDSGDNVVLGQMNEIITGLGCIRDTTSIDSLVDLSTQTNFLGVDIQIAAEIRARIAVALVNGSYEGVQIVIRYLTNNFASLLRTYESAGIVSILNALGPRIVTEEVATSFDNFVTRHVTQLREVPSMYDAAVEAQTIIAANLNWRKTYGDEIEEWLQKNINELPIDQPGGSSLIVLSKAVLFMTIAAILRQFL